ncbi:TonB-dependent receptor [Bacteroidales bacterium OttesenSCG-928-J19]|nr:TonB-dependent receptor [Bacteroidales bacterium OttesenSCG-928-J19]
MKRIGVLLCLTVLFPIILFSQNYTISGTIIDSESGETLIGASVFDLNTKKGVVSNTYGFYSLTLPAGEVQLQYSFVGCLPEEINFTLSRDTVIPVRLTKNNQLHEVVVVGTQNELGVSGSQMGAVNVSVEQIKAIPTLFGENDLIKALQLLPGVQSGTEGFTGFYVRGGGPDENLFLLDGVPLYNVSHMGGFFSTFNTDALKNVTLYKGGFPARFGSRLSSVLDIRMNDGNNQKIKGSVGIGLISSKLNLEGPLGSEKTTFNISARRTYFDILAKPLIKYLGEDENYEKLSMGYYFYDLNAKITHRLSDKDKLFLSFYMGDDVVYSDIRERYQWGDGPDGKPYTSYDETMLGLNWGNLLTVLRWNRIITSKLFMNTTATYTRYRYDTKVGSASESTYPDDDNYRVNLVYKSGIEDLSAKVDFDFIPNPNHDVKFGVHYTNHRFRPGVSVAKAKDGTEISLDTVVGNRNIRAHETIAYLEDNMRLGAFIKANLGLHYSTFYVQDHFYHSLQPRISMRALINKDLSFKAAYTYMSQYIHLLSNNTISLPTDLWVPVTSRITPMNSHQVSAGFFYNFRNWIDFSVEAYYKTMDNLIEYKDGASFLSINTDWQDKVNMGRGWAYGIEFLAQKTVGKTTGWLGYTWAKTERLFDRPGEELNFGLKFPAKYDRRHDLSIVLSHKFSEKIDVSGTWVYSTGNWSTLALQEYSGDGGSGYISRRNNYRNPGYHRLDLGVNFHKQKKHGKRTWNISVYNAYNQMNPFLIYKGSKETVTYAPDGSPQYNYKNVLKQVTIFPIIPSVSYIYTF